MATTRTSMFSFRTDAAAPPPVPDSYTTPDAPQVSAPVVIIQEPVLLDTPQPIMSPVTERFSFREGSVFPTFRTPDRAPPELVDDVALAVEDYPVTINVLHNDFRAESILSVGSNGPIFMVNNDAPVTSFIPMVAPEISIVGNRIVYDPNGAFDYLNAGETASDTFTYTALMDDGSIQSAEVFVTILGADDLVLVPDFYQALLVPGQAETAVVIPPSGSAQSDPNLGAVYFALDLQAGQTIQIDVGTPSGGDPTLNLLQGVFTDPVAQLGPSIDSGDPGFIEYDDDGGPGLDSRITFTAPTSGLYTAVVNDWAGTSSTETYEISYFIIT